MILIKLKDQKLIKKNKLTKKRIKDFLNESILNFEFKDLVLTETLFILKNT